MSRGKFITLEGIEGSGKTTCLNFISEYFDKRGISSWVTREPGGTEIGESIRMLLLDSRNSSMHDITELLLVFAARNQHLVERILPALRSGTTVVCSRFTESTYAYQGYGRGVSINHVSMLENLVQGTLRPDMSIVLDVPSDVGMKRVASRGEPLDRFEQEGLGFFDSVRHGFIKQAISDATRFSLVDSTRPLKEVKSDLVEILDTLFGFM